MAASKMASHNGPPPPAAKSTNPPNQSLYLTNLPEKLSKPDLRTSLYTLFATHGPVLDVNAMRSDKMRGQAHIAYRDVATATQAMRSLQGFAFFGKEMRIQYARGKSDAVAKLDGTYRMPSMGGGGGGGAGGEGKGTELQKEVFGGVPGAGKGVKRGREEEEQDEVDEDGGAPMEQDSDDDEDAPMEEDSGDDD